MFVGIALLLCRRDEGEWGGGGECLAKPATCGVHPQINNSPGII
jgi:hypothetical protein